MPEKITQVRIVESNHLSTVPLSLSERPLGHRPRYSTLERTDEEEVHVTLTGGERVLLSLSLTLLLSLCSYCFMGLLVKMAKREERIERMGEGLQGVQPRLILIHSGLIQ